MQSRRSKVGEPSNKGRGVKAPQLSVTQHSQNLPHNLTTHHYKALECGYDLGNHHDLGVMRRLILVLVLVLVLAIAYRSIGSPTTGTGSRTFPTLPGPAPNAGDRVSSFVHQRYDGGNFELSDRGVYVLTFWDSLNRDSNEAQTYFAGLAQDFKDAGVQFAAVYIGGVPKDVVGVPYTVLQDDDGSLAAKYNVKRVPRIFIISDGRVYAGQNTFLPENYELLRGALTELVSPDE
jgi:hypothetical protein